MLKYGSRQLWVGYTNLTNIQRIQDWKIRNVYFFKRPVFKKGVKKELLWNYSLDFINGSRDENSSPELSQLMIFKDGQVGFGLE